MATENLTLILASSSPYRRELLSKLGLSFQSLSPEIDETPRTQETPEQLVLRLGQEKALKVASQLGAENKPALIIASDQVAVFHNEILGKPITEARAVEQLMKFQGQSVTFLTSLCLYSTHKQKMLSHVEPFIVHFRERSRHEIETYVATELPLQCAGSFKSEGLGITLFRELQGRDPNSLIGLPLIALTDLMRELGINLLDLKASPLSNSATR
ncbi:MAG: Maf family protein [Idiomarinaceae bacterium HL-53]|nr:MAG: Maf family protein [Idiomarinaceae bacterium HL-53]CUS48938.1 MAF protein [Idiomarinaceae bacterium HL-53]